MYILKLAWRYVHARIINFVAVLVVGMTLMASITVLGVIDGMLVDMERRVRNLGEQVTVYFYKPVADTVLDKISGMAGVTGYTPQIQDYALLRHGMISEPAIAYGIDLKRELELSELASHLQDVVLDPANPSWIAPGDESGLPGVFMGLQLAQRLALSPGDVFTVNYSPPGSEKLIRQEFILTSIFHSGSPVKDRNGFYLPIEQARKMFYTPANAANKGISAISFFLNDPDQADVLEREIARKVVDAVGRKDLRAGSTNWKKQWSYMRQSMAYENMLMEVVLFFMNLSAGFCVFAVLATLVSRRVRDVGLLRCLGAGRRHTVLVFLVVGLLIGFMGVTLGVLGGYLVGLNVNGIWEFFTGQPLYPPHMFQIAITPVIYTWKVLLYSGVAILISVISALYPAVWAGCREPVEALRDE